MVRLKLYFFHYIISCHKPSTDIMTCRHRTKKNGGDNAEHPTTSGGNMQTSYLEVSTDWSSPLRESTLQLWILMPSLYGLHLTRCGDDFWGPFPCSFRNPNELWASPVKTCMVLPHSRVCPPGCLWITDLIKLVLSPCLFSPRISLSCSHPPLSVTVQSPGASVWDLPSSSVRRGEG